VELVPEQRDAQEHQEQPRTGDERQAQDGPDDQQQDAQHEAPETDGVLHHGTTRSPQQIDSTRGPGRASTSRPAGLTRHGRWVTKGEMDAREKIISTAVRLFSSQGYGNTSLSQVAKEAEVSKALIFWHFDNKETLFRTAVQRTLEPYFINVLDDLTGLTEVDQIKRLIDQYYTFVSENLYSVKFFLSLILREEKHPADLVGHMNELQRVYLNLLADILESGRRNGLFRESINPRLDAGLLMRALHGIRVQGFLGGDVHERSKELLAHLKSTLVDALRRQPTSEKP